jgi:hypothetical protein
MAISPSTIWWVRQENISNLAKYLDYACDLAGVYRLNGISL